MDYKMTKEIKLTLLKQGTHPTVMPEIGEHSMSIYGCSGAPDGCNRKEM